MANYILADNQDLTCFAVESLLRSDERNVVYRASDRTGLVQLLKEHESATVVLDYTLFDFADVEQLVIVSERFVLSQWLLSLSISGSPYVFIIGYACVRVVVDHFQPVAFCAPPPPQEAVFIFAVDVRFH